VNPDWGSQQNALDLTSPTGSRKTANWWGIAGYVNYNINDQWRVSVRGEYFDDEQGYRTGIIQKWSEGTVTLAYMPVKAIELRAELRADHSDKNAFTTTDNVSGKSTQQSFGLEALYKF
jgi:hypothetical protein